MVHWPMQVSYFSTTWLDTIEWLICRHYCLFWDWCLSQFSSVLCHVKPLAALKKQRCHEDYQTSRAPCSSSQCSIFFLHSCFEDPFLLWLFYLTAAIWLRFSWHLNHFHLRSETPGCSNMTSLCVKYLGDKKMTYALRYLSSQAQNELKLTSPNRVCHYQK